MRFQAIPITLLLLVLTAGCGLLDRAQGTTEGGYISGDGQIVQVAPTERDDAVELSGTSLEGEPLDAADYRGRVVVVNVWWSGCPPCREEMPMLVEASEELGEDTQFLGIDIRDTSAEAARAFVDTFDVPYPSLYDPTGKALLAFSGVLSPRAIPSTVVLDREGRVAASILGPVPSKLTLTELVDEIAAADG